MQSNLQEKYVCMKDVKSVPDRNIRKVMFKSSYQTNCFLRAFSTFNIKSKHLAQNITFSVFAEGHLANSEKNWV